MCERAALAGIDAVEVGWVLDRLDAEYFTHEVGMGTAHPCLKAGGRRRSATIGGRRAAQAGEASVESSEDGALAAPDEVDAEVEHVVVGPPRGVVDGLAGVLIAQEVGQGVLVVVDGEVGRFERCAVRL